MKQTAGTTRDPTIDTPLRPYEYKHGDQPLAGYTVQHAVGRGGFGEVYYAISDTGRQVALKSITGGAQIELRGIRQCMNLKSPYLVSIYDVKYNAQGRPFVVMEYVRGPSLEQIIDRHPNGLGPGMTGYFLREIARGLTDLHEAGIVHRDLKPANIFYEDGYVKIGDYGLSKAIGEGDHSGQTMTVGTLHYMAPEVGEGKYGKSIDIYAMGVMLYEMLLGRVPYQGRSPAEILLKHVSHAPDLSMIEPPFDRVIGRAMSKDPGQRYQSVQQMVDDVLDVDTLDRAVAGFQVESLDVIGARIAEQLRQAPSPSSESRPSASPVVLEPPLSGRRPVADRVAAAMARPSAGAGTTGHRLAWALGGAGMIAISCGLFSSESDMAVGIVLSSLAAMCGGATGLLLIHAWWRPEPGGWAMLRMRLAYGGLAVAGMLVPVVLLAMMLWPDRWHAVRALVGGVALPMFVLNWPKRLARGWPRTTGSAVWCGLLSVVGAFVLHADPGLSLAVGVGLAIMACSLSDPRMILRSWHRVADQLSCQWHSLTAGQWRALMNSGPARAQARERVSPHRRLWTVVLWGCGTFGFCGLHRLYVGRLWTGLLWLCTFGLFGVGQLFDLLLIALGGFRDREGRRILVWHDLKEVDSGAFDDQLLDDLCDQPLPAEWLGRVQARQVARAQQSRIRMLFAVPGACALVLGLALGLVAAADLTGMLGGGVLGDEFALAWVRQMLGVRWPLIVERGLWFVAGLLMLMGTASVVLSRANAGLWHVSRAIAGAGVWALGLFALRRATIGVDWQTVGLRFADGRWGAGLDLIGECVMRAPLLGAGLLLTAGLLLLMWPYACETDSPTAEGGAS